MQCCGLLGYAGVHHSVQCVVMCVGVQFSMQLICRDILAVQFGVQSSIDYLL